MPRIASTVLTLSLVCFMVMGHLLVDAGPQLAPLTSSTGTASAARGPSFRTSGAKGEAVGPVAKAKARATLEATRRCGMCWPVKEMRVLAEQQEALLLY
eukprot:8438438-Pyramimonas_sp.AAC.1